MRCRAPRARLFTSAVSRLFLLQHQPDAACHPLFIIKGAVHKPCGSLSIAFAESSVGLCERGSVCSGTSPLARCVVCRVAPPVAVIRPVTPPCSLKTPTGQQPCACGAACRWRPSPKSFQSCTTKQHRGSGALTSSKGAGYK